MRSRASLRLHPVAPPMSTNAPTRLVVTITGDDADLQRVLAGMTASVKKATGEVEGEAKKVQSWHGAVAVASGTLMANAIQFAAANAMDFFRTSIQASMEADADWQRLAGTLQNVGVEFGKVEADLVAASKAFEKATTFDDEGYAQTLTKLTQITGSYEKAVKNVGLVADVAAGRQTDLASAAVLVGKAANGNTAALKRLGITIREGESATEALQRRFKGMAENETKTLAGQSKQMANQWGNFKERVGDVLVVIGAGTSLVPMLTSALESATVKLGQFIGGLQMWAAELPSAIARAKMQIAMLDESLGGYIGRQSRAFEWLNKNNPEVKWLNPTFGVAQWANRTFFLDATEKGIEGMADEMFRLRREAAAEVERIRKQWEGLLGGLGTGLGGGGDDASGGLSDKLKGTLQSVLDDLRNFNLAQTFGFTALDQLPDSLRAPVEAANALRARVINLTQSLQELGGAAPAGSAKMLEVLRSQLATAEAEVASGFVKLKVAAMKVAETPIEIEIAASVTPTEPLDLEKFMDIQGLRERAAEFQRLFEAVQRARTNLDIARLTTDGRDDADAMAGLARTTEAAERAAQEFADAAQSAAVPTDEIRKMFETIKPLAEEVRDIMASMETPLSRAASKVGNLARGFGGLLKTLGGVGGELGGMLDSIGDIAGGVGQLGPQIKKFMDAREKSGSTSKALGSMNMVDTLAGFGAIAGGVFSIVGGLFGESEAERERKELLKQNTEAIKDLTARAQGLLVTGSSVLSARGMLAGDISAQDLARLKLGGVFGMPSQEEMLAQLGMSLPQLKAIAEAAGIQIVDSNGRLLGDALKQLQEAIGPLLDTMLKFNQNSFADLTTLAEARAQLFGYANDPARMLQSQLAVFEQIAGAAAGQFGIDDALGGTAAGRAQIQAGLQQLFAQIEAGLLTPELLGGFGSVQELLAAMVGLSGAMDNLKDAASSTAASLQNIPSVVSLAFYRFKASQREYPVMPAADAFGVGAASPSFGPSAAPTVTVTREGDTFIIHGGGDPEATARAVQRVLAERNRDVTNAVVGDLIARLPSTDPRANGLRAALAALQ
jgi:hypothetical protein